MQKKDSKNLLNLNQGFVKFKSDLFPQTCVFQQMRQPQIILIIYFPNLIKDLLNLVSGFAKFNPGFAKFKIRICLHRPSCSISAKASASAGLHLQCQQLHEILKYLQNRFSIFANFNVIFPYLIQRFVE